ncbi:MAG: DNA mismatch repair protein MutS, partial [Clostridia bacterium]|nr:DNA mismatch repair protein MutS [Clostridia bacterium]
YYYGKYKIVDLHNMIKEDAKINLIYAIETVDFDIKCLVVVHGYHGGVVIKKLVRDEFKHSRISEKINLDAGRTIYLLKN